jgi:hypothetical protein
MADELEMRERLLAHVRERLNDDRVSDITDVWPENIIRVEAIPDYEGPKRRGKHGR